VGKTKIIIGTSLNVYLNLAYEEYLVDSAEPDEAVLFLWQNSDTVVIGCNQNPWRECNLQAMERDQVKLSRRVTGGGAVFHDIGNMNFSFIVPKSMYDVTRQGSVIVKALEKIGLHAEQSGRNDITVDGRKFSGNAFLHRKNTSLHHGTVLIGADMSRLMEYLNVDPLKLTGKGIQSVSSRVVNLREFIPDLSVETMMQVISDSFSQEYGIPSEIIRTDLLSVTEKITALETRNTSFEWLLGKTPHFSMNIRNRFSWGDLEIGFENKSAIVTKAMVFSDSLLPDFAPKISESLAGSIFGSKTLSHAIRNIQPDSEDERIMLFDVSEWLENYSF